jgi:hypothetical protein
MRYGAMRLGVLSLVVAGSDRACLGKALRGLVGFGG